MNTKYNIRNFDDLTPEQLAVLAEETEGEVIRNIKGHTLYLIGLDNSFGFSCIVFYGEHHIRYADDFELHHRNKTKAQLRSHYIARAKNILYTDDEIASPVKDYTDYVRRQEYLVNHYSQRRQHQSLFSSEPRPKHSVYDHIAMAYYDRSDMDFVMEHTNLWLKLQNAKNARQNDMEYWIGAFYYEMLNHEYMINMDADFDTLSAFGDITYLDGAKLSYYFDQLHFNDTQREAYRKALMKVYRNER